MPTTILTDIGEAKIANAAGTNDMLSITHIALGSGINNANYEPDFAQTALRGQRIIKPIDSRIQLDSKSWKVKASFAPNTASFMVREIGFFDGDGDLIALWAGVDVNPRQTGVTEYIIEHVLNFSRVADGLVIVAAPDDELFEFGLRMLREQASQRLQMFQMNEQIRPRNII